ncbi:Acylphosphatase [Planctomycetes bacterium Pan216]|uniref:acylphosphatase n=1 Tax=Kolteria novifilia TaxID=2527975 RepID=A0A518AX84_9BACT|nr:Acylphosphatase [Planctomycetes bacterium Pan216]
MSDVAERRRIQYSGFVQGVGFRFTTSEVARRFDVTGYVKNLANGDVEVVVEGYGPEIDRFVRAVDERMKGNIGDIRSESESPTGEFDGFAIM